MLENSSHTSVSIIVTERFECC